jgi:hypothetical protein
MKSDITCTEKIEKLKLEIKRLEYLLPYEKYFKRLEGMKNSYIVEMRRLVSEKLYDMGYNKMEIGEVIHRDHSSVIHLLKVGPNEDVAEVVRDNYMDWIENDKYPISVPVIAPSYIHPSGYKTIISCEVRDLSDIP